MRSVPQPTPSTAAPSEGADIAPETLAACGLEIAAKGMFGLAWLDAVLVVRATFGPLAAFIASGRPLTDSVPPLIGLENEILALSATSGRIFELPAVAMVGAGGATPKLNFSVLWLESAREFLLIVYRSPSQSDIELELTRQVRARLMAEAEVAQKSRALEIANRDLEQFAAIVSHDLNAPLRALRYLSDDAVTALSDGRLDAAGRLVADMRVQARRMTHMMSALLDYASAGRKLQAVTSIDTGALVRSIVASLPRPSGIDVVVDGAWPRIDTLEAPLDLVLRNLIDNAVKHHDHAHGRIVVTARDPGPHLEIEVTDDGPGIPAAAREAVFHPFRTLDGPAVGTGMGLALVKRMADAVGGSVRIAPTDAPRGTTFIIRWPKLAL